MDDSDEEVASSLRKHICIAFFLSTLLIGGLGVATAFIEISGAVIAPGRVVVETNVKRVQHQEGGIVQEILVQEGQVVEAGAVLVRLDDTLVRANLRIIDTRLNELGALEARLEAEAGSHSQLKVPNSLVAQMSNPEIAAVIEGQRRLLEARRVSRDGRKAQLSEQIRQFEEQISGLASQRDAKGREIELIVSELEDLAGLMIKGLVRRSRIAALEREEARIEGERGGFISEIARAGQSISERKIQILQIDEETRAEAVEQQQNVRAEIAELREQRLTSEDQLRRTEIRAPRAGSVQGLSVHTIGGVIAPAEEILLIVPHEDVLVIEVEVAPTDVDQLVLAQKVIVRLPGFDQRTTPELHGEILTLSADLMEDPTTGLSFYQARITLSDDEVSRLGEKRLVSGMPVEAFVQTESRTILSYLLKPLTDQIAYAFREG
ncbi:HlyD family type I secretion periplasmic adaptor subunit [Denitrobaculum tricleocarpae]|uniref:Membrane fusion protein (MFP) family protein n=1 Tax=Denitrobaculum tricleocarpae TaxID=2591009 RepID=A0A545TN55_9PROT|nr:HlyD family type I secretion periplasmic adaptor subunit [Denitrobaculum tricleocarpae]TQV78644.1 HlyD family type I secretion periplasmic adaptor subunit [Denitrobaculum tricleocarpae]